MLPHFCLECRDLSFYYGKARILHDINFGIQTGEWLAIIGPNGSGKSTLLKNILRLVEGGKSFGQIIVNERPINDYSQRELARILAYVPQAGGRIPPFTVREFVNLSRYPFGYHSLVKENAFSEAVNSALELTSTLNLAERRMDTLSGGQRQRVYLAAALAQSSPILLLDEPASFLDPRHVHEMNETLKYLHEHEKRTIVIVTHDLNQPLDVGGKSLVIKESEQIFFGPSKDLTEGHGILESAFGYEFSYLRHPRTQKPLVVT